MSLQPSRLELATCSQSETAPFTKRRGHRKKPTKMIKEAILFGDQPARKPGCSAAAEDSVQFLTYSWHRYILFMAHVS